MPAVASRKTKSSKPATHAPNDATLQYKFLSGTVVPQRVYIPRSGKLRRQDVPGHIDFTTLSVNMVNTQTLDVRPGIFLHDAMDKAHSRQLLDNALAWLDIGDSVDMHVLWPARYCPSFHEILPKPKDSPYWTRVDLAYAIAKSMREWREAKDDDAEVDAFMKNTCLLELRQVAPKGWQPVFMETTPLSLTKLLRTTTPDSPLGSSP